MYRAYIICRSQTEALRAYRLLEGAGIRGVLTRPPREDRTSSCAYAVRIRYEEVGPAQEWLDRKDFAPCKVRVLELPDGRNCR